MPLPNDPVPASGAASAYDTRACALRRYGAGALAEARRQSGVSLVFDWFRRLVPRSADFFVLFERHSAATVAAAEALSQLVRGEGDQVSLVATIRDREHDADDVTREVLTQVRQTFLTPFDRGAIIGLIAAMDDVTDEIQSCASAVETYDFKDFAPEMREMAAHICRALHQIDEALPLLRDVPRNGSKLHELTGDIVRAEGEVDLIHERGLKANFIAAKTSGRTVEFIVNREIFKHLEKVADSFEDVANQIDGIVIDYA
jgi:predicted phosphate transport protein (TIGR00153 family)